MTEILPPLNTEAALKKKEEIDALLGQINVHELRLAGSYARLGSALKEVKVEQYWVAYNFDRFSSYLESIWQAIGKKRSQIYNILSVAETLLPLVPEDKLEEIGITKANELRRLVNGGLRPDALILDDRREPTSARSNILPEDCVQIMDYAADPKITTAQLRVKVNELLHQTEEPQGLWYEPQGFYATPDERKEIEGFWELGRKMLELDGEVADHAWKKQVFLAAVRECASSWSPQEPNLPGYSGFLSQIEAFENA